MPDVGGRWLVNTVAAVPLGVLRLLRGAPTVALNEDPWIGVWYFALLGLYELFGLHDAFREMRKPTASELARETQR